MNNDSKNFLDVLRQSLFSSFVMLFAGIVLGMLLFPMELDRTTHYVIMILAMGLFVLGVILQTKREQNNEKELKKEMNIKFDELQKRIEKLEPQTDDKNLPKTDIITNDNSKSKFGKFLESEKNNVIILVSAGIALTFSTTSMDLSLKFGSGLIASGLFIWAIFRRAKSNYGVQTQINDLRKEIDKLKGTSKNNDDSKPDNQ